MGDQKYLALKDKIPSFYLAHKDEYKQFISADTKSIDNDISFMALYIKKHCGVNIAIRGILRIEHTENDGESANMRVVYYAEPISEAFVMMTKDCKWINIPKKDNIQNKMKDNELYAWINYLEYENGNIYPMNIFTSESEQVHVPNYEMQHIQYHDANFSNFIKSKSNDNDENNVDESKDNI